MTGNTTQTGPIVQEMQNQQNGQSSTTSQQPPIQLVEKITGSKTLREWLNVFGVFLVPLMIGVFTIATNLQQSSSSQQQHNTDMQIAQDQQRAAVLQNFINDIQDLLLNHNLLASKPTDDVAILARARTLTALQGLDPGRKGHLLIFLHEARLIGFGDVTGKVYEAIINLADADFTGTDLTHISLTRVSLANANLTGANLTGANLTGASLNDADLRSTVLTGATLTGANLTDVNLSGAFLNDATLSGATLTGTNLTDAILTGAKFTDVNLTDATLTDAKITQQQLNQTSSCHGAILPTGVKCRTVQKIKTSK